MPASLLLPLAFAPLMFLAGVPEGPGSSGRGDSLSMSAERVLGVMCVVGREDTFVLRSAVECDVSLIVGARAAPVYRYRRTANSGE